MSSADCENDMIEKSAEDAHVTGSLLRQSLILQAKNIKIVLNAMDRGMDVLYVHPIFPRKVNLKWITEQLLDRNNSFVIFYFSEI